MNLPERKATETSKTKLPGRLVSDVELPLENAAFAIREYLASRGQSLDPQTRALLLGVGACMVRAADSARDIHNDAQKTTAKGSDTDTDRWVA